MARTCPSCGATAADRDRFCPACGVTLPPAAVADSGAPTVPIFVTSEPGPGSPAPGVPDPLEEKVRAALSPTLLLVRRLGEGGMGSVYLAREPALRRLVAVKVLSPELAADEHARARFEREAQAVAGLGHPNVVAIYGVGELSDATPYFVMQYVPGRSMAARLEEEGPLDVDEARRIVGEVATALAAAHAKGIIHRDIKPANILYDEENGRALVSDFGIVAVRGTDTGLGDTKLTKSGMLVGTPQYMSPEQLLAEPVTEKTDMYALGLLAYELLRGRGPFQATTPQELIAAHLRDTPAPISVTRPDVDPELEGVITACLAKDSAARPTAADIARRLTPGAGALLEWPPPGLDRVHGRLARHGLRLWIGSLALGSSLLAYVALGTVLNAAAVSLGSLLLGVLALVGTAVCIAAAGGLVADVRRAGTAVGRGFTWLTVAEAAADPRGDTGALIAGTKEYAGLLAPQRSALRLARVVRGGLWVVSGMLPAPMLVAVAWLGVRAGLPVAATPWLVLGPSVVLLAVVTALAERERRAVALARHRLASRRRRPEQVGRLVAPWYASFDAARGPQPLGRGAAGRRRAGITGGLAVAALAALAAILLVPLWLIGANGAMAWIVGFPKFANTQDKARIAEVDRPLALPPDPTISPLRAGEAFWTLQSIGGRPASASGIPEHQFRRSLEPLPQLGPADPLFVSARHNGWPGPDSKRVLEMAAHRQLTPAELDYLRRLATHPAWEEYGVVARAPSADFLGARFQIPFPGRANWLALPIPRFASTKELAYANSSRAAYYLATGRPAEAEQALRETISFGFQMANGSTLIEALIGVVIVGIGHADLQTFYALTGRREAAVFQARRDSVIALVSSRTDSGPSPAPDVQALRRTLGGVARDTTLLRGLRFEMLALLGLAPCTNVRELVFGLSPSADSVFAESRRRLARFPSERALLDLMWEGPERGYGSAVDQDPWSGTAGGARLATRAILAGARAAAVLLGNRRIAGCAELLSPLAAGAVF